MFGMVLSKYLLVGIVGKKQLSVGVKMVSEFDWIQNLWIIILWIMAAVHGHKKDDIE